MKNQTNGNGAASSKRQPKIDHASKRISLSGEAGLSVSTTTTPAKTLSQSAAPGTIVSHSVKGGHN